MTTNLGLVSDIEPMLIDRNQPGLVKTPYVKDILRRAVLYIEAGFPIHFRGPAGAGKTTLAMYVAAQIGQPVILDVLGSEADSDRATGRDGSGKLKIRQRVLDLVSKHCA